MPARLSARRHFLVNTRRLVLAFVLSAIAVSCSESEREEELEKRQPAEDKIAEDCVAFVRATKATSGSVPGANCPTCPADGIEVLIFRQMKTDKVSCSGETCQITVTIRAVFNPGRGDSIGGGLTAWIAPGQRAEYLRGQAPEGEQNYRVKIIYKRTGEKWRAIEFDKADA